MEAATKRKVAELEGAELDMWVANAAGMEGMACGPGMDFSPSTDWRDGGPIIDREMIETSISCRAADGTNKPLEYTAEINFPAYAVGFGRTPLTAAMRCFVASRFGDEVGE